MAERCRDGGPTKANKNCTIAGPDGWAVQCVGPWAQEKHDYIRRYIEATREVRRRFIAPAGTGGAAFIDLFAGPGKARVRDTGVIVDGTPMIAVGHRDAPFTSIVLCDLDGENVEALRQRTTGDTRVHVVPGDSRTTIDEALRYVPSRGLNIALLDPFGLEGLDREVIAKLARFERMDLLIHFPTTDIKRNFFQGAKEKLDRLIGRTSESGRVSDVAQRIEELRAQLATLGYTGAAVRSIPVKHAGRLLYHVMFASKNERGDGIWESISKTLTTGQRRLF